MTVFSLVASHHDLDLDTVARLSAGATGVGPALPGSGAAGAIVLATCNRVEIYAEADGAGVEAARTGLLSAVAASTSLPDEDVHTAFRTLDADATARHLFEVGAGLDSAVVGEREIAGQVRRAGLGFDGGLHDRDRDRAADGLRLLRLDLLEHHVVAPEIGEVLQHCAERTRAAGQFLQQPARP